MGQGIDDYRRTIEDPVYYRDVETHTVSGTLKIKTLFIADDDTRFRHYIVDSTNELKEPESFMHFSYLCKDQIFDQFNYPLPLAYFDPNYSRKDIIYETFGTLAKPRALKGPVEWQAALNKL